MKANQENSMIFASGEGLLLRHLPLKTRVIEVPKMTIFHGKQCKIKEFMIARFNASDYSHIVIRAPRGCNVNLNGNNFFEVEYYD
ncbi:MAG: hypothetical protein II975_01195 [Bacteroidales bacterium]|nr:hypothetical protein [Bacteroidales bacterium]